MYARAAHPIELFRNHKIHFDVCPSSPCATSISGRRGSFLGSGFSFGFGLALHNYASCSFGGLSSNNFGLFCRNCSICDGVSLMYYSEIATIARLQIAGVMQIGVISSGLGDCSCLYVLNGTMFSIDSSSST